MKSTAVARLPRACHTHCWATHGRSALILTVYQHAAAKRDLVEQFVHLAEEAGLYTAQRFLTNARASFNDLPGQVRKIGTVGTIGCEM